MRLAIAPLVAGLLFAFRSQGAPARSLDDQADLTRLGRRWPSALPDLERGERLLALGDAAAAVEPLRRARDAAHDSAVVARTYCRALAELGQRARAVAECERALALGGSVENLRFAVGALMAGSEPVSVDDLARASLYARGAELRAPQQPWGYAASLDIAERLGDPLLRERMLTELRTVAPEHEETLRSERRSRAAHRPPFGVAAAWGLVLLVLGGTAAHALVRKLRRPTRGALRAATVALAVLAVAATASAAEGNDDSRYLHGLSRWPIDPRDPLSTVPSAAQRDGNPLEYGYHIMDLLAEAAKAARRGDHAGAAQLYMAVARAAPEQATGFSKACESFEKAGSRQRALEACGVVVARPGVTVGDYQRFARLVFQKDGALDDAESADLTDVVAHLRKQNEADAALDIECELGLRRSDRALLRSCVTALEKAKPGTPRTLSHAWALALLERRYADAERFLAGARRGGLTSDALATMERATLRAEPWWWRLFGTWQRATLVGVWVFVAVALGLAIRRAAATTPRVRGRSALAS